MLAHFGIARSAVRRGGWQSRRRSYNLRSNEIAVVILVVLLTTLPACANGATSDAGGHGDGDTLFPKLPKVTGHIDRVDANPENLRHFSTLHVTDADGRRWQFRSEGWVGVSVGHLKDHQIQGTPITVWYERLGDGALLARFVGD